MQFHVVVAVMEGSFSKMQHPTATSSIQEPKLKRTVNVHVVQHE